MNKETLDLLQALAAKLNTTADHLWAVMVRQAYVSFATDCFYYLVAAGAIYALIKGMRGLNQIGPNPKTEDNPALMFIISMGIVCVVIVLVVLIQIPHSITKVANPEYWALKQVFDVMRGN